MGIGVELNIVVHIIHVGMPLLVVRLIIKVIAAATVIVALIKKVNILKNYYNGSSKMSGEQIRRTKINSGLNNHYFTMS